MNYRHAFHAGNFADVLKHLVLARIVVHLRAKPTAFRVVDTHAGAGLYDLSGDEAVRTGEWRHGIGRVAAKRQPAEVQALLAPYLDAVLARNGAGALRWYPGSPLLALALLRPQDRLVACELAPAAAASLAHHLRADRRAKAIEIDGYTALNAFIPPKERRGLVLIDPPFEDDNEFDHLATAVANAHRKWPTGIFLLWYPIKDRVRSDPLAHRLSDAGVAKMLRAELMVGAPERPGGLSATGVIVVNPPWRLADELRLLLAALAPLLARDVGGGFRLDTIEPSP